VEKLQDDNHFISDNCYYHYLCHCLLHFQVIGFISIGSSKQSELMKNKRKYQKITKIKTSFPDEFLYRAIFLLKK